MDKNSIIKEWFYRLPNGYANAPYSKAEMDILHKVLEENKLNGSFFTNEVDQLDQAFLDAEPVQDEAEVEKITSYLEKDMKKKDFSPMARKSTTAVAKRMIGKFAEDENWQQWLNTVEGVVSDKKLQKLYFTLYDITSATYTAKYIDEVLDELYSMNPKSLDKYLFSSKSVPAGSGDSGMTVPEEFYGLADIGTARGGSKGTEMGRGEFLIPFLFDRGELGGANATHDVTINGQGWHVKELKNRNTYIRLGMKTFSKSKLARTLSPVLKGNSENEFALKTAFDGGMVKEGVIEALNTEYGGVENDYDALMTIQEQLDIEMRRDGVIFYVAALQEVWFVPTEDCICGGGTQGAHTVGMSHSGRPEGKFAAQAKKIG